MGRFAVGVFLVCIARAALAQQSDEEAGTRISVGARVINAAKYPGADSYRLRAIPVISLSFGRFFVGGGDPGGGGGGGGVGMNILRDPAWRLGVALAPGFAGYTWGWLSANLRLATDIEGEDQGTLATVDLSLRPPLERRRAPLDLAPGRRRGGQPDHARAQPAWPRSSPAIVSR